jgi:RNA polymerase-binding transcription factor DksA
LELFRKGGFIMATKKNTTSKADTTKKSVAKTAPAKKVAKTTAASVAKPAEKKAPAKAKVKDVATKPAALSVKTKDTPKAATAKPEKKQPPKAEAKSTKKVEAKVTAKAEPTPTQKPEAKVETPASVKPVTTSVRTPSDTPTKVGNPLGVLKPNYGLIRPKSGGKKTGSVRHVTRSAFKDEDLEEFKRRLLEEREKKVKLQNAMSNDALSRPDEENVEEDGTNSSNRADMLQRAEETRKSLRAIDDALRAIENKTYGICSMCKCAISRERLRAAPFAIRCVKCKEEWERQVKNSKRSTQ